MENLGFFEKQAFDKEAREFATDVRNGIFFAVTEVVDRKDQALNEAVSELGAREPGRLAPNYALPQRSSFNDAGDLLKNTPIKEKVEELIEVVLERYHPVAGYSELFASGIFHLAMLKLKKSYTSKPVVVAGADGQSTVDAVRPLRFCFWSHKMSWWHRAEGPFKINGQKYEVQFKTCFQCDYRKLRIKELN